MTATCIHGRNKEKCDLCFRISRREKPLTQKQIEAALKEYKRLDDTRCIWRDCKGYKAPGSPFCEECGARISCLEGEE